MSPYLAIEEQNTIRFTFELIAEVYYIKGYSRCEVKNFAAKLISIKRRLGYKLDKRFFTDNFYYINND